MLSEASRCLAIGGGRSSVSMFAGAAGPLLIVPSFCLAVEEGMRMPQGARCISAGFVAIALLPFKLSHVTREFLKHEVRTSGGEIGKRQLRETSGGTMQPGFARPHEEAMEEWEGHRCNELVSGRILADMLDDTGTESARPCDNPIPIIMLGALGPSSTRWPLSSPWWCRN